MTADDEAALLEFFLGVPESERWFLKEDVTSPRVIHGWAESLDYKQALPLLAVSADGKVVADAVLVRRRGGSRAHVAELRIVVAPAFRERGLGVLLMRELCDIANDAGLERVVAEMVVGSEDDAIVAAEWMGFYKLATLEAMAKDLGGQHHDVQVMAMPLGRYYEWSKF
jgi:L-amino acid N-acyltransferase YncA